MCIAPTDGILKISSYYRVEECSAFAAGEIPTNYIQALEFFHKALYLWPIRHAMLATDKGLVGGEVAFVDRRRKK
jgi:hypothetical protein